MPTSFLGQHYDPAADPGATTAAALERLEQERIWRALSVVLHAQSIPRRLGGDALDSELALEKLRCRREAWALTQSVSQWTKEGSVVLPRDAEIRREGSQLIWESWLEMHLAELRWRTKVVATWATLTEHEDWGKQAVVRLNNEFSWVTYGLRD